MAEVCMTCEGTGRVPAGRCEPCQGLGVLNVPVPPPSAPRLTPFARTSEERMRTSREAMDYAMRTNAERNAKARAEAFAKTRARALANLQWSAVGPTSGPTSGAANLEKPETIPAPPDTSVTCVPTGSEPEGPEATGGDPDDTAPQQQLPFTD